MTTLGLMHNDIEESTQRATTQIQAASERKSESYSTALEGNRRGYTMGRENEYDMKEK